MNDREAYLILNALGGIGPIRMEALLNEVPSAADIFHQSETVLSAIPGITAPLVHKIKHWNEFFNLDAELRMMERGGVTLLTREDDAYPSCLKEIHNAPVCLYVRGVIPREITARGIAMVGTRNISHYGEAMARQLAESAAFAKWVVVSGLAVGVDTVVHRSTVNAGGKTVAVLGGGLARLHPQENLRLARDIITTGGAVISEYPMTMSPTRNTFPMRNRIISGLTLGTIVIEAGLNSGSLITAAQAVEQGRRIFAVPGNVNTQNSNGCNDLIRKGAVLIENFDHVLEEFDFLPGFDSRSTATDLHETNVFDNDEVFNEDGGIPASPVQNACTEALRKGDLSLEQLSQTTGFPAGELMSALIALEILHSVKRNLDGTFHRIR